MFNPRADSADPCSPNNVTASDLSNRKREASNHGIRVVPHTSHDHPVRLVRVVKTRALAGPAMAQQELAEIFE